MNFLKRIVPRSLKLKLKKAMGSAEEIKLKRISEDLAERIVAKKMASGARKFEGMIVVVTGASGFIGEAICRSFLDEGAIVCACARNLEKLDNLYGNELERLKKIELDVTLPESVNDASTKIEQEFGKIDVLVNCAGGSSRNAWAEIYEQDDEIIDEIIRVNLLGTLTCIKYFGKCMVRQGKGRIINISSAVGVGGKAGFSEYAAAKAAIIGATKSIAIEMGAYGVTVNCVSPGIVNRGSFTADKLNEITSKNCVRSVGTADDIAYGVSFFASNEANFITGQNLIIDGGRSLGLKGD